jgi:hypothetical protein
VEWTEKDKNLNFLTYTVLRSILQYYFSCQETAGVAAPVAWFPFAGWKDSFYGDLHATGSDAFTFFTERRVMTEQWY